MKEKIKIIGILVLAGFSFLYTEEVSKIIKKNGRRHNKDEPS